MIARRNFLATLPLLLLAAACKKREERCASCGMKLDMKSPWRADLLDASGAKHSFDTPRCALHAWRSGLVAATGISVQDFYERLWRDGRECRFVIGSDVLGPMGADLVPVAAALAEKFTKDHAGRPLALDDVTLQILKDLG